MFRRQRFPQAQGACRGGGGGSNFLARCRVVGGGHGGGAHEGGRRRLIDASVVVVFARDLGSVRALYGHARKVQVGR